MEVVYNFNYVGGILSQDGCMEAEICARAKKALYAIRQMNGIWRSPHLSIGHKMLVYNTFVVPHMLYGAETWNSTVQQEQKLERLHSSFLRSIAGVTR